ncbi:MAG: hypothetical protein ABWK05_05940 [Pyrobaculum sp.]
MTLPAGLLGLVLGDGSLSHDRVKIVVQRGYEDAVDTLLKYSLRAVETPKTRRRRKRRWNYLATRGPPRRS